MKQVIAGVVASLLILIFIGTGVTITLIFQNYQELQQEEIDTSYQEGYQQGLLYTQQTGNVVIVSNQTGELVVNEYPIQQFCGVVDNG